MRLPGVLFLTLSAATPASSFFVIVPDVLRQAGTGALWAMAGAAVVAAAVAQVYAELASAFPFAGGEYAMAARVLGPAAGFAMLAVNAANALLGAAVLSLGVADQLSLAVGGAPPVATAVLCAGAATGLGLLNVRASAWVTGAFLLVEVGALAMVAALGFAHPVRGFGTLLGPPLVPVGGGLGPVGLGALGGAMAAALFAYDGYGSAVYFAEELREPRRRVAQAVTGAVALVVAAELVPLAAAMVGAPDLPALLRDGPAALAAARAGPGVARLLAGATALAVFNAVIAMVLLSARQLYGAARDGAWPDAASRLLAQVDGRFRAPWAATLAAGGATALLCLVPPRLLLMLTGTGVTAIYAGLCVVLAVGRRTGRTATAAHRAPGHPWTTAAVLAVLLAVLAADGLEAGEGRTSLAATAALALAGALWGAGRARSGRWRPTEPPEEPHPAA